MGNSNQVRLVTMGTLLWATVAANGEQSLAPGRQSNAGTAVEGQGAVTALRYDEIRCRTEEPRLVLFVVKPNQTVKKGDLLVELDTFALTEERQEQEIRLMRAKARLAAAVASFPGEREMAEGTVAIAEGALRLAERQLVGYRTAEYPAQQMAAMNEARIAEERAMMLKERQVELEAAYKEQPSLKRDLLEVRLAATQAQAESTAASGKLALLKDMIHPLRTEELELAIAQRKLDLLRAKNALARVILEGEAGIEDANSVRQMEIGRFERLMNQIDACKLYAPRDGTAVSPNDASLGAPCEAETRPGDTVRPGQLLLRLADLTMTKREAQTR